MVRYRIKTREEFEDEYNSLPFDVIRNYDGFDDWLEERTGWDLAANCCGGWFGHYISKSDYMETKRFQSYDGELYGYSVEMECARELYNISSDEGRRDAYDCEWRIKHSCVTAERYGKIIEFNGIKKGDVLLYRNIGRVITKIFREPNNQAAFEFIGKNGKKIYVKSKNAKILENKVLSKIK